MAITVNTNMSALKIQSNLSKATDKMNDAMQRMSTGLKINSSKDDAAGYAVATNLKSTISGTKVAQDNVAIGNDLLSTTEGILDVVSANYQRVRDLVEQAANGTYTAEDRAKLKAEIDARLTEIDTLTQNATFNGKILFDSTGTAVILQSGVTASDNVTLGKNIFSELDAETLRTTISDAFGATYVTGGIYTNLSGVLSVVDTYLDDVTDRISDIGAAMNKLEAVADALTTQDTNLTSALSTIQDADTAEESANYVQAQILQQASATLLTQANSAPQIALSLIQGQ